MKFVLAAFLSISCALPAWGLGPLCSSLFHEAHPDFRASPSGIQLLNALARQELLGPFVKRDEQRVTWQSFESLKTLKPLFEAYAKEIESMDADRRSEERRELYRLVSEIPSLAQFFEWAANPPRIEYKPAEYDLKLRLYVEMIRMVRILPPDFRPRMKKMAFDQRRLRLDKEAAEFMREQEVRFDKLFSTTGYENYAAYEQALRASEDPYVKKAIELIDQDKIQVVMKRPENGRFWIPKTGFHNQYVSGTSRGYNGKEGRYNAESTMTARTKEEYWPLDDEVKPKYGTLRVEPDNGVQSSADGAYFYGEDLYVFKKVFRDRLSVFPGDSLNHLGLNFSAWSSTVGTPSKWDMMLIPWSRRLLLVPFMVQGLRNGTFLAPGQPEGVPLQGWNDYFNFYWESQIFGRVDLDMVESFEFKRTPPSGEFLAELKKRNIKIFDARQNPPKEWVEGMP